MPTLAPWYSAFMSELLGFPAGKHDEQVDALGLIGQLLDRMVKGVRPEEKAKPIKLTPPTWDEAFKRHRRNLRRLRDAGVLEEHSA